MGTWRQRKKKKTGVITFTKGGFAASPSGRDEFSAKLYYESKALRRLLNQHLPRIPVDKSLEIGCGYGRLSPFISEFAQESFGIEPNEGALSEARIQYPNIKFRNEDAGDMSFGDEVFDLVVAWTVLHHIPPDSIDSVCSEIQRVTKEGGVVVISESVSDEDGPTVWGRSGSRYEDLLGMELQTSEPKPVERTYNDDGTAAEHPRDTVMVFTNS